MVSVVSGPPAIPPIGLVSDPEATSLTIQVSPNTQYTIKLRVRNEAGSGKYGANYTFISNNIAPLAVNLGQPVSARHPI